MWGSSVRIAALAMALVALLGTGLASAATLEVTRTGDPAPGACTKQDCSLREAVLRANGTAADDRIVLKARTYRLTIPGEEDLAQAGDLDVAPASGALAISGRGPGKTAIDGTDTERVLQVPLGARLVANGLTVQNGRSVFGGGGIHVDGRAVLKRMKLRSNTAAYGGAIYNTGRLVAQRVAFVRNQGELRAGAVINQNEARASLARVALVRNRTLQPGADGGGIYNQNTARMSLSAAKVVKNSAHDDGGGIFNQNDAHLTIRRSTIADNRTHGAQGMSFHRGAGIFNQNNAILKITDSTVSGNVSPTRGGGLFTQNNARTLFKNSTISGNRSAEGGAAYVQNYATARFLFTTIARNRASSLGGAIVEDSGTPSPSLPQPPYLIFLGALVAANASPGGQCVLETPGVWQSLGGNVESGNECQFKRESDRRNAKARIGKLKRNGGPTKTHALKRASAAVDAAKKVGCPRHDQRAVKRPQGERCDAGAYERKRR